MSMLEKQAIIFMEMQTALQRAALELFAAHGVAVSYSPGGDIDTKPRTVMSTIGYATNGLRGALVLVASQTTVAALQPEVLRMTAMASTEMTLRDVLGEFANMLTGRMKNKLLRRGIAPMIGTPTSILGEDLELPAPRSGVSAWQRFSGPTGEIFIRLDATLEADFALGIAAEDAAPPIAEGDMVLF
jgi:CheY-specific phosphatase CheX